MNQIALARAQLKNFKFKPNASELRLLDILNLYYPGQYVFNNGVIIEGKVPDFINVNGKRIIIELIGRRDFKSHSEEALEEKKRIYAKYGFETVFIYQKNLKDPEEVIDRIIFR